MKKVLFLIMLIASSYATATAKIESEMRFYRRINNFATLVHSLRVFCGAQQPLQATSKNQYQTAQYSPNHNTLPIKLDPTTISRNRWRRFALAQAIGSGIAYYLYATSPNNTVQPADQKAPALSANVQKS